jgi:hypothetical protein
MSLYSNQFLEEKKSVQNLVSQLMMEHLVFEWQSKDEIPLGNLAIQSSF